MSEVEQQATQPSTHGNLEEKRNCNATVKDAKLDSYSGSGSDEPIHRDAQDGVQQMEAVTSVWSTQSLVIAYIMIWFIYFFESMQQGATQALDPFVTSAFQEHSLTPTSGVMSSIIGGVLKLTLAKTLDVFGRPQGYALSIFIATIGLIMMAACRNVEAYAAAKVFYTLGNNSLMYSLSVFVADTSSLRNRGLMLAYSSSPFLITTWLSGPISEAFLEEAGWRWCFGMFSVVAPNTQKAKKAGFILKQPSGRTFWQSILYYCREFDAVGLLLFSAGLAMFLLPFNLWSLEERGWQSPVVIALLVVGFVVLIAFGIWERFFAPINFIPFSLLTDPTVAGACVVSAVLFMNYFCWFSFFRSFLQVVNDLDVTKASYVTQTYTIGSCLCSILVSVYIRYTGRFKPVALYFGLPLTMLGMGLMIYFRQPDVNVGYIVMCQIFISFGGGAIIITDSTAAMAAASHQHITVILAVLSMFGEVGGAIGLSIAAAIWTGIFPEKLALYLPVEDLPNLPLIYADLTTQLTYPVGSATRAAIQMAYGDAQQAMLIAGTVIWAAAVVGVMLWRDINVKGIKQVTGHVA